MAIKQYSKNGSSESEEIYFLKENDRLIQKIHEKNHKTNNKLNNVIKMTTNKESPSSIKKKAA